MLKYDNMRVRAYSITKTLFEGDAEKIIARTSAGEVTILDGHIPLITVLSGPVKIFYRERKANISLEQMVELSFDFGFMEVRPEHDVILLSSDPEASRPIEAVEISHRVV